MLNGNQSAGALVFNVSNGNGYTLSQGTGGALTLARRPGPRSRSSAARHTISAPLVMAGNLAVSTAAGTSLQLSGDLYQLTPGLSLTTSGSGQVFFSGVGSYTGNTTVSGGTLQITGGQLPAAHEYVGGSAGAT